MARKLGLSGNRRLPERQLVKLFCKEDFARFQGLAVSYPPIKIHPRRQFLRIPPEACFAFRQCKALHRPPGKVGDEELPVPATGGILKKEIS